MNRHSTRRCFRCFRCLVSRNFCRIAMEATDFVVGDGFFGCHAKTTHKRSLHFGRSRRGRRIVSGLGAKRENGALNGMESKRNKKKRKEKGKKKRNRRRWHCETLSRVVPCSYHLVGSRARLIKVGANWHRRPFGRLKRIAARFRRSITHTQRQLRWRKFAVSFGSSFGRSCWLGLVLFLVFVRCEPVRM